MLNYCLYVLLGCAVWDSKDPTVNVVLLEDAAAVLGVVIAAGCMGLTSLTGSHIPDAVGSLLVGSLLGAVAMFIIQTNSNALVGRSISPDKIAEINQVSFWNFSVLSPTRKLRAMFLNLNLYFFIHSKLIKLC
jgi:Co/Zn/Cd efflux system component